MKIFLDIDNTICSVDEGLGAEKYARATPIVANIHRANKLYEEGNHITYWTARGKASGVDYSELTRRQLTEWGCKYHELRLDKPSYDLYVDDKSQNTLTYFGIGGNGAKGVGGEDMACDCNDCKITAGTKVDKGWGHELVIANSEKYCGKVLHFKHGARFSMHYHLAKTETWYVASGQFEFRWIDTRTADMHMRVLNVGDIVTNAVGQPHQLICLREGDIFEVSTQHFDSDSYRVMKGDSQGGVGAAAHKNVLLLMHMGLGDHIMMTPAVFEVAKQTGKLYVVCKANYVDALKSIYSGVKNLELITIAATTDEHVIGSEIQRVLGELQKRGEPLAIAASGMYNSRPNPPYPFPCGFYKDIGLDFMTCRAGFKWEGVERSRLLDVLKQLNLEHVFVHDVSSTQKADRISGDALAAAGDACACACIALNPDRNMYKHGHPFYYLAQLFVRAPSQSILDYISIMESARGLYLIDSCYFSMSAFIDLSAVRVKNLYKRADVKYEWLTTELGWNEMLL